MATPAAIDVAILAGGLGTRLRGAIGDRPKVLAPVAGRAFLDLLLDRLAAQGFRRVVLLLGHRAEIVLAHLAAHPRTDLAVATTIEPQPLGTAGALRAALPLLTSDPVMVLNGDTLTGFEAATFIAVHARSGASATLLAVEVPDAGRYGALEIDVQGRLLRFHEKRAGAGPGLINAGVYLLGRGFLDGLAASTGPSLERDVLERQPPATLATWRTTSPFIDIGTPESLAQAPAVLGLEAGS